MWQISVSAMSQHSLWSVLEISMYVLFVSFLTYDNLLHQAYTEEEHGPPISSGNPKVCWT